jgi:geranylgeranyl diphosphate synthase type I
MNGFKSILSNYSKKVEKELKNVCAQEIKKGAKVSPTNKYYYEAFKDFLLRGGKRLRPISFIMACRGIDPKSKLNEIIKASLSVEFLHNGTLSHDDVMDEDRLRRGGPTSWVMFSNYHKKKWGKNGADHYGESLAILQGNSYTTAAFSQLLNSKLDAIKKVDALKYLNHYFDVVNNGQVFDLTLEKIKNVTDKNYLKMVEMKTGALFEGSIVIGAALGGANNKQMENFKTYAVKMGQAFQMQDDVLGTFGSEDKFGKPTDSDIKEGKRTMMVIYALKKSTPREREVLLKTLGNRKASKKDVKKVKKILVSTGAVDHSKKMARKLAQDSKRAINKISLGKESKEFFLGLADYVLNREA